MNEDQDLSAYWCWNKECSNYGKKGKGNLRLHERYGKDKRMLLTCKTCGKMFSETRGTVFFGLRTPRDEVLRTLALLPEKGSIRGIARATGRDKNTVCKWVAIAGAHAKEVNEYFLHGLELSQVQIDEIWSYIKKRTKS
ncbi:MAG: hypothetical protein ACFFBD_01970 [Candidatus Hodarchaeota archaeon]